MILYVSLINLLNLRYIFLSVFRHISKLLSRWNERVKMMFLKAYDMCHVKNCTECKVISTYTNEDKDIFNLVIVYLYDYSISSSHLYRVNNLVHIQFFLYDLPVNCCKIESKMIVFNHLDLFWISCDIWLKTAGINNFIII